MDYLHLHDASGMWRVRIVVPPALVPAIGKKTLLRSTGTADYDRAVKIAKPIIREFAAMFDRAASSSGISRGRRARRFLRGVDASTNSEWYAPEWLFRDYLPGIVFDVDVAAPPGGVPWIPARRYFTKADDGLAQKWNGFFVWCNPPFGVRRGIELWLQKFIEHGSAGGDGLLLTSSNSYTKWWQRTAAQTDAVLLISGYVNFVDGRDMTRPNSASFGSCLFAVGHRGVAALREASANGLGVLR